MSSDILNTDISSIYDHNTTLKIQNTNITPKIINMIANKKIYKYAEFINCNMLNVNLSDFINLDEIYLLKCSNIKESFLSSISNIKIVKLYNTKTTILSFKKLTNCKILYIISTKFINSDFDKLLNLEELNISISSNIDIYEFVNVIPKLKKLGLFYIKKKNEDYYFDIKTINYFNCENDLLFYYENNIFSMLEIQNKNNISIITNIETTENIYKYLSRIYICDNTQVFTKFLFSKCTNLKELKLENLYISKKKHNELKKLKNINRLELKNITRNKNINISNNYNIIKKITKYKNITFFKNYKDIKYLYLHTLLINNSILKYLTTIQYLYIYNCNNLNDNSIKYLKNVKYIEISKNSNIIFSYKIMKKLQELRTIKIINIENNKKIKIINNITKLKKINKNLLLIM